MRRGLWTLLVLLTAPALLWAAGASTTVRIQNMQFAPETVTIQSGDTVVWKNGDDRDHSVVAVDGSFDSGNIPSGDSYRHTFKTTGKFDYKCSYHPRMRGVVVVRD